MAHIEIICVAGQGEEAGAESETMHSDTKIQYDQPESGVSMIVGDKLTVYDFHDKKGYCISELKEGMIGCPEQKGHKSRNIPLPDTHPNKATVMIMHFDAHVAHSAVEWARGSEDLTSPADHQLLFSR